MMVTVIIRKHDGDSNYAVNMMVTVVIRKT